ncbi:MAG: ABC transporter substrate-binding protein [Bdellovibrionales bacterium]|nr:ABC transporter substrate-binding protein [Bdellovibrionales bacterium]
MLCLKAVKTVSRIFIRFLVLPLFFEVGTISFPSAQAGEPKACRTVITLSPALAQVVLDLLGATEARSRLIGVSSFSPLPRGLKIQEVASSGQLNIERVLKTKADCIFEAPGVLPSAVLERLNRALEAQGKKSRMIRVPMDSLTDISEAYQSVGVALGVSDRASILIKEFEEKLVSFKGKLAGIRVLIQLDDHPLMVVGGGKTFLSDALRHLGVINVYSSLKEPYPRVSAESAVAADPERVWILADRTQSNKYEEMSSSWKRRFPSMKAVREGGVRIIYSRELTLPTRGLIQGLQTVLNHEAQ